MSMIRTIVGESERNDVRLSFKKYKEMTAKARGVSLAPAMMQKRHKFNLAKGNPRIEKQEKPFFLAESQKPFQPERTIIHHGAITC